MQDGSQIWVVAKCPTTDGALAKGQWKVDLASVLGAILVCCPDCGRTFPVGRSKVMGTGVVIPEMTCPFRCGFHKLVRLEGWTG